MATSHVAGGIAALWSLFPECDNNQIRNIILRTAKSKGKGSCNNEYGHGILQLQGAYDILKREGCDAGGEVRDILSDGGFGGCEQGFKIPRQCENDIDCNDGNYCTTDICDVHGSCNNFYPDTCSHDKTKVTVDITTDEYGSEKPGNLKKQSNSEALFFGWRL